MGPVQSAIDTLMENANTDDEMDQAVLMIFNPLGPVQSALNTLLGDVADERDVNLAVEMIREHYAALQHAESTGTPVPWTSNFHYLVQWDTIRQVMESAPLPTYVALANEGMRTQLRAITEHAFHPNSHFATGEPHCDVCSRIAYDENVDFDGPIGGHFFFGNYGSSVLPGGRYSNNDDRSVGLGGRNRRMIP
jgi:hypothetical protein